MAAFEVVFHGQVRPEVAPEQARVRIGQLFQVGDRQLDVLFSGRRVVIKQGLDQAAAEKYRQAIERAGAMCEIQPMADGAATAGTSAEQRTADALPPRDEFMAAFSDVEAPDLPLAPLGADMQDSYTNHAPLHIDLSAFSLAPPGSDLEQLPEPAAPPAPDVSHLRVADGE